MTQRPARAAIIATLGVTQILAWGSSFYLPAVLAGTISRDMGWPLSWVVGGLSAGLLVAAAVSPRVGAMIERRGGRPALAASAAAFGLGEAMLALAPNLPTYFAAWAVIGVGMGAGLYDAAFATLGRLYGREARSAITLLTLIAGFSSTLCWPLTAVMANALGWRGACLVYAAIQFGFALPLYLIVLPRGVGAADRQGGPAAPKETPPAPRRDPTTLILLGATTTLAAGIGSTLSVHLIAILQAGGVALAAAVALGAIVGPSQVAARLVELALARRHHPIWTKLASVGLLATGVAALASGLAPPLLGIALYGAGAGLESIARGALPLAIFGPTGYAALMGRLALPSLAAQAAVPWLFALLLERAGAGPTLATLAALALLNVALAFLLRARIAGDRPA